MPQQQTQEQALQERQKYVAAFNDTMIKIWKERITLLDVIDTKTLAFREYGLWQDYGTGRETPRGNPGDIGRAKVRQRRRWFSIKYYASFMNIKEFYADNLGKEFIGIINEALDDYNFRRYHGTMRA